MDPDTILDGFDPSNGDAVDEELPLNPGGLRYAPETCRI